MLDLEYSDNKPHVHCYRERKQVASKILQTNLNSVTMLPPIRLHYDDCLGIVMLGCTASFLNHSLSNYKDTGTLRNKNLAYNVNAFAYTALLHYISISTPSLTESRNTNAWVS